MKNFLFILLFIFPSFACAEGGASLSLFPAVGTYQIGDEFTISVNVDTGGSLINGAEGSLSFDKDELEVVELSKEGSILESWTTEPAYSKEEGAVSFGGGMKSFTGAGGKILSITFHALKNTEAKVRFSTGAAILAADGQGTNILTVMNAGAYNLVPKEIIPVAESEPEPLVLGAATSTGEAVQKITVTSSTHPDENKWYNEKTAEFKWLLPDDANTIRLSMNASSSSIPTEAYPPVTMKIFQNISDGIFYFHLRAETDLGWGETVRYRFQTDTAKPDMFRVAEASTTGAFGFIFDANDKTSGIEKYLVSIDGGAEAEWRDGGGHMYIPEAMEPGSHALLAKAVDFAGNFATSSIAFVLHPIASPSITDFQENILPGDMLFVRGTSEPNATVSVWVRHPGSERAVESKVMSGTSGEFVFILGGRAEAGAYEIFAETLGRGVKSEISKSILITAREPKFALFGKKAADYLSILIPLATLAILFIFILVFAWHQFRTFRKKLQKEIEEVEAVSHESFEDLRKEIYEDERILAELDSSEEKTKTKEDKRKQTVARLNKSIDTAEEKVEKEITIAKEEVKKPSKVKAKRVG
jgi:hypothetical protein